MLDRIPGLNAQRLVGDPFGQLLDGAAFRRECLVEANEVIQIE
jgi:hypothetical protein